MLPLAIGFTTLLMLIPTFYAFEKSMGLALVGIILSTGRCFDIITDPVIGFLSDHFNKTSIVGARRFWVGIGLILFCIGAYLLFIPPSAPDTKYLLMAACIYFLGFTIAEIPLAAMGLEISNDTNERTRLALSKTSCLILGGLIGATIPSLWSEQTVFGLRVAVGVIILTSAITLPIFLWFVPESNTSQTSRSKTKRSIWKIGLMLAQDPLIRRVLFLFLMIVGASAFSSALSLLYLTYIIEAPGLIGPSWAAAGIGLGCGLPLWYFISKHVGKWKSWRLAILGSIIGTVPLCFLGAGADLAILILSFWLGICAAADALFPVSILADHVAQKRSDGQDGFAGMITAAKNTLSKLAVVGPLILAFPLLERLGLNQANDNIEIARATLTPLTHVALIIFYAGIPAIMKTIGYLVIGKKHGRNRVRIY